MSSFKLQKLKTRKLLIEVLVMGDFDKIEETATTNVELDVLTDTEWQAIRSKGNAAIVNRVLKKAWPILDEDGQEQEWSDELKASLADHPDFGSAIANAQVAIQSGWTQEQYKKLRLGN